jgi:uncharacterized protein (TIGR00106 family)
MLAQFNIVPLDKGVSVGGDVAKVLQIIDNSGLPYKLNPMGTVVEGTWNEVMELIRTCHEETVNSSERVLTSISIDDRKGSQNRIEGKITSLEKRLNKSLRK